ncbi:hypothetical protein [Actinophytocola sediminis]
MVTPGHRPHRAATVVAGAVAAVVLAGCSTPSATPGFDAADLDAALTKVPTDVSTVHGLDLPLDRSLLTPVEEMEVIRARNTLIERCLADHGLTYAFPPVDPVRDAATQRRHGLVDAGEAAVHGYRDPAVFATRDAEAPAQPSPEVLAVITGTRDGQSVPADGCAGEADRTLAADGQPGQEVTSFALSRRSHDVTRTTPPVIEAAAVWSRCMATAGFQYDDPDAAITDPAFSAGRPSAHEITVATLDVRCKERAEWVRTWVGVERAVQEVLIQQHAADVAREQRHKEQQLAVAREVNG